MIGSHFGRGSWLLVICALAAAAHAGPVILGTDNNPGRGRSQGDGAAVYSGWLYIPHAVEEAAVRVTLPHNDGTVVVLCSADSSDWRPAVYPSTYGSNSGAAYHFAVPLAAAVLAEITEPPKTPPLSGEVV